MFHKSRNIYEHKQPIMQDNKKNLITSVKFNYYSVLQTEKEDRIEQLYTSNTCQDIKPKLFNDTAFQYRLLAPMNNILPRKIEFINKIKDSYHVSFNQSEKKIIKQERTNSIIKSIQDSYYVCLNKDEKQLNKEERSSSIKNITKKLLNNLKMTSCSKPQLNDNPYYVSSKLQYPGAQQNLTKSHSVKSLSPTVINMNNVTQIPKIKFQGRSRFKINLEPITKRTENNSFKQASDYQESQWVQTERSFVKHLDLKERQVKCNFSKEKLEHLKGKITEMFYEKQPKQLIKDVQKIKEIIKRNQDTNQIWELNNRLESIANNDCQQWQYEDYNFDPISDYVNHLQ